MRLTNYHRSTIKDYARERLYCEPEALAEAEAMTALQACLATMWGGHVSASDLNILRKHGCTTTVRAVEIVSPFFAAGAYYHGGGRVDENFIGVGVDVPLTIPLSWIGDSRQWSHVPKPLREAAWPLAQAWSKAHKVHSDLRDRHLNTLRSGLDRCTTHAAAIELWPEAEKALTFQLPAPIVVPKPPLVLPLRAEQAAK